MKGKIYFILVINAMLASLPVDAGDVCAGRAERDKAIHISEGALAVQGALLDATTKICNANPNGHECQVANLMTATAHKVTSEKIATALAAAGVPGLGELCLQMKTRCRRASSIGTERQAGAWAATSGCGRALRQTASASRASNGRQKARIA